ncbi:hypothetical protein DPEC_G00058920 [Dallia pectoralis]|uniref:Uncharacterized protein n=1 Tax=Dallia pectoralis TaxID=75939 RepID=A0ACC2H6Y4_DALPE|nr:hypothetical protein DPEC_G00058920 [Dallia pectoralis]
MARSELGRSVEVEKGRRRFPNQPTLDRNDCFHTDMYSDGTRTGHYGLINCKTGDYCCCHYCDLLYGATLYQGRPGTHGATLDTDHPQPDLRDDYNLPPFPVDPNDRDPVLEKCGRGERGDRGEEGSGSEGGDGAATVVGRGGGGQRAPQRRPVFSLSGLYYQPQPDQFSLSHPWEFSPEEGSCPVEPGLGLRHCSPVREHCSCVAQRGGIAAGTWTHPFASGGQALSPPLNPGYSQFIGGDYKVTVTPTCLMDTVVVQAPGQREVGLRAMSGVLDYRLDELKAGLERMSQMEDVSVLDLGLFTRLSSPPKSPRGS